MAFSYPKFHGNAGEDGVQFLENLWVSCIINHILDQAQVLCLLQICLKSDSQAFFKDLEAHNTESKQQFASNSRHGRDCQAIRYLNFEEVRDMKLWCTSPVPIYKSS